MARRKSALRRRLNVRWLRWSLARLLIARSPALSRRFNFYDRAVTPSDFAVETLEDGTETLTAGFTAEQKAFVTGRCCAYDSDAAPRDGEGVTDYTIRTTIGADLEVLGHTGAVVSRRHDAIMWTAEGPPSWNLAKPRILKQAGAVQGCAFALTGTGHYFHVLMNDILPLFDYLERLHPAGEPLSVIVPRDPPAFTFQILDALAAAFPGVATVRVPREGKVRVAKLVSAERRPENREWFLWEAGLAARLKQILIAHLPKPDGPLAPRLFVTRGNAKIRRLRNEPEIAAIVAQHGFETFCPAAGNFAEQVHRFDAAEAVVAVHGAGLTNLMWCRPGASVLELFPENFAKSTFLWLADRIGMRHHAMLGTQGDYDQAFEVSAPDFERRLGDILAEGERRP